MLFRSAVRDLVDLDRLLRVFGQRDGFWKSLVEEAVALGLTRPAYYAVRYTHRWFDTPVPGAAARQMQAWAPPAPVRAVMDALVTRTLPDWERSPSSAAALALYVRSHWLRMPPLLLARHLLRKATAPAP